MADLQKTLDERGAEYGDFGVMCDKIQAIKQAYGSLANLPATHAEALEMIATKIGRILTGNPNNEDSWRDIAGYATLVADRLRPPAAVATKSGPEGYSIIEIPRGITLMPRSGLFRVDKTGQEFSDLDLACRHLAAILRGET